MSLFLLLLAALITWMVYRRSRSVIYATAALIASLILLPIVFDQLTILMGGNPVPNSSQANTGQISSSCNCN